MDPVELQEARGGGGTAEQVALLLGVVAGFALFGALAGRAAGFAAGELGLGLHTYAFVGRVDGRQVSGAGADVPALLAEARRARQDGERLVLWLGASQLHAINEPGPGDRLAVERANERARGRGARLRHLQLSEPNANLTELLALYLPFRGADARPDRLVVAATFDDLDEGAVREGPLAVFAGDAVASSGPPGSGPPGSEPPGSEPATSGAAAVTTDARVRAVLARFERAREAAVRAQGGLAAPSSAPVERTATAGTAQEWLEARLVGGLERAWPAYAARADLRSAVIAAWKLPLTALLYRLFDRPGNRSIDAARQRWNEEALDALLALARADGVRVLVYKAPHRPGEARFYHDRAAYDAFHAALAGRCRAAEADYLDLETLVPAGEWGLTNNYLPDVFHFHGEGHRLLGQAVDAWIERAFERAGE